MSGDCKPPDVCKGCTEALPWEYPSQYKVAQDSYFKQHGFPSHCETQDGMSGYETWEPSVSDKHTIEEKVERIFEGLGKKLQNMVRQFLTRVEVSPASFQRDNQSENMVLTPPDALTGSDCKSLSEYTFRGNVPGWLKEL